MKLYRRKDKDLGFLQFRLFENLEDHQREKAGELCCAGTLYWPVSAQSTIVV